MRKIRVDYTSDLHLMMLVNKLNKSERFLTDFVENQLVAQDGSRGDWLVIAGDIAEYNSIVEQFLTICSRYWEQVFFVFGNHDLWLWSKTQSREYDWTSDNKKSDIRARVSHIL